jgi:hypothetical protein
MSGSRRLGFRRRPRWPAAELMISAPTTGRPQRPPAPSPQAPAGRGPPSPPADSATAVAPAARTGRPAPSAAMPRPPDLLDRDLPFGLPHRNSGNIRDSRSRSLRRPPCSRLFATVVRQLTGDLLDVQILAKRTATPPPAPSPARRPPRAACVHGVDLLTWTSAANEAGVTCADVTMFGTVTTVVPRIRFLLRKKRPWRLETGGLRRRNHGPRSPLPGAP